MKRSRPIKSLEVVAKEFDLWTADENVGAAVNATRLRNQRVSVYRGTLVESTRRGKSLGLLPVIIIGRWRYIRKMFGSVGIQQWIVQSQVSRFIARQS
jgi:hypothetical protein